MKSFLHVVCSTKRKDPTKKTHSSADWPTLRFDLSKEALSEEQIKALAVQHMTPL